MCALQQGLRRRAVLRTDSQTIIRSTLLCQCLPGPSSQPVFPGSWLFNSPGQAGPSEGGASLVVDLTSCTTTGDESSPLDEVIQYAVGTPSYVNISCEETPTNAQQRYANARPLLDSQALCMYVCIHWAARFFLGPIPARAHPLRPPSRRDGLSSLAKPTCAGPERLTRMEPVMFALDRQ